MLLVVGYLLGGVPFGFVVSKAMGLPDPRTVGSKEVGLINVLRVSGRKAGILTLMGDMGKGWVMGFAATQLLQDEWAILFVALAPFLGYLFSPFSDSPAARVSLQPLACSSVSRLSSAVILLYTWLAAVALWRYSSGGALTA